jgi:hypothetical protein
MGVPTARSASTKADGGIISAILTSRKQKKLAVKESKPKI